MVEEDQEPPMECPSGPIIARGARRLANDPRVIASALSAYQARTGTGEVELASWLELSVTRLHRLALCDKPNPEDPQYAADVLAIARYVNCNADRLRVILDAEQRGDPR